MLRHTSAGEYYNYLISKEIIKEKAMEIESMK